MQKTQLYVEQELQRIQDEYVQRASSQVFSERYSLFNEAALLQTQSLERNTLALLKKHSFAFLANKKILDIGCGNGLPLQRFLAYGARPQNLSGIDLLPARIEQAQTLNSAIDWRIGSAHQLPYPDASFDLVSLSVVFSSILNQALRSSVADEAWRVCKPNGLILYYDFAYSNPQNSAVEGISRQEMQRLFQRPGAYFDMRRITLAPPLSRLLAPRSHWLASTLEQLRVLNTHLLCVISRNTHETL